MKPQHTKLYVFTLTAFFLGAIAMGFLPSIAHASTSDELQAQLSAAQSKLDDLNSQAEAASEQVNETQVQLDDINAQIDQTEADIESKQSELDSEKQILANRIVANYKGGGFSLVDAFLDSDNIEDLISSIYYADKVSEQDAATIQEVENLRESLSEQKQSLEDQKSQQEDLLTQQTSYQQTLSESAAEEQDYINGLSDEVQEALEAEQAAQQQAAAEAAAEASTQIQTELTAAEDQSSTSSETSDQSSLQSDLSSSNSTSNSSSSSSSSSSTSSSASSASDSSSSSSSSVSSNWRSTVIAAAKSMVGGSYIYGAYDPSDRTFDCSGLVSYCYAVAGISVPHSSASLAAYCTKSISEAEPGDIVWRTGHVGIYIGGGITIEAFSPSQGIGYGSLSSFSSCGS